MNDRLLVPIVGPPQDLDEVKVRHQLSKINDSFIHVDIILKIPHVDLRPSPSKLQVKRKSVDSRYLSLEAALVKTSLLVKAKSYVAIFSRLKAPNCDLPEEFV